MKKISTLLLLTFAAIFQTLNAQTNPALVTKFDIDSDPRSGYRISWAIANNEVANKFELQKSVNGRDFTTIAVFVASAKRGTENYTYTETITNVDKVMYRLKILSKGQEIYYSKILLHQVKPASDNQLKMIGNPVNDKLTLSFNAGSKQLVDLKVYNMSGKIVLVQNLSSSDRNNIITIPLNSTIAPGIYIVEINNGIERQTARFVKQ